LFPIMRSMVSPLRQTRRRTVLSLPLARVRASAALVTGFRFTWEMTSLSSTPMAAARLSASTLVTMTPVTFSGMSWRSRRAGVRVWTVTPETSSLMLSLASPAAPGRGMPRCPPLSSDRASSGRASRVAFRVRRLPPRMTSMGIWLPGLVPLTMRRRRLLLSTR